ncbi:MAG: CDP-diacylglycerol diphosphatase [Alphaproteobacteria bacterium]|nr:CDP-diacylglycerol diphosphatase [Alphaproteobacteria bacterium]
MAAIKPMLLGAFALAANLGALGCTTKTPEPLQAQACLALPKPPDTLLKLAECCAARLDSNPGCRLYDQANQYVIIKDNARDKPRAYLIVPTVKVTGIEDPLVLSRPVVDFWQYGWARSATYPGRPASDTALAINSADGRTQNQLHIHISCVRHDVKDILLGSKISSYPGRAITLRLPPQQHIYQVVRADGLGGSLSPFVLIHDSPAGRTNMANQSIAVVGSSRAGEYFVLSTTYAADNPAFAEELLDQSCS